MKVKAGYSLLICAAGAMLLIRPAAGQPAPAPVTQTPAPMPVTVTPTLPALVTPALPPGAAALVPTTRALTLNEAIALALEHQPQLALAQGAMVSAAGRTRQAVAGFLPSLSVGSQYTKTGPARGAGGGTGAVGGTFTTAGYTTNFSARQLLYDFGKTSASTSQARQQEQSAKQALAQTRQDTANQVKQSYYTMLQNQRLVEVQQSNLTDQQAHLDLARARFDAGVAPRADVVRAETAVANAILNLATAQNTAAVSRVSLNLAMGIDIRHPTLVEETEEQLPTLPAAGALVEQALGQRPEMKQAQADVKAARSGIHLARTGYFPALSATANYGLRGSTFPPSSESWSYGVVAQWPLFDGGATPGRIKEAEGNLLSAAARLRQAQQTVSSEVVQAYLDVQTAAQKVKAAEAEVANGEESLRLAAGRYQAGVAAYIEVIDAETALVTARTNRVNALYGLSIARAALERAMGLVEGM